MSTRTPLPNRFKELREAQGLSEDDLAKKLYTTRSNIVSWEDNEKDPSIRRLIQMANVFNCSLEYLLCLTEEKTLSVDSKKAITDICINPEDLQKSEQSEETQTQDTSFSFGWSTFILCLGIGCAIGLLISAFFL